MENSIKKIKDEIKAIRLSTGLSQASFAFSLGVHPQTVVNWETYIKNNLPNADLYLKIKAFEDKNQKAS